MFGENVIKSNWQNKIWQKCIRKKPHLFIRYVFDLSFATQSCDGDANICEQMIKQGWLIVWFTQRFPSEKDKEMLSYQ